MIAYAVRACGGNVTVRVTTLNLKGARSWAKATTLDNPIECRKGRDLIGWIIVALMTDNTPTGWAQSVIVSVKGCLLVRTQFA